MDVLPGRDRIIVPGDHLGTILQKGVEGDGDRLAELVLSFFQEVADHLGVEDHRVLLVEESIPLGTHSQDTVLEDLQSGGRDVLESHIQVVLTLVFVLEEDFTILPAISAMIVDIDFLDSQAFCHICILDAADELTGGVSTLLLEFIDSRGKRPPLFEEGVVDGLEVLLDVTGTHLPAGKVGFGETPSIDGPLDTIDELFDGMLAHSKLIGRFVPGLPGLLSSRLQVVEGDGLGGTTHPVGFTFRHSYFLRVKQ